MVGNNLWFCSFDLIQGKMMTRMRNYEELGLDCVVGLWMAGWRLSGTKKNGKTGPSV